MKKKIGIILSVVLTMIIATSALSGCGGNKTYDNETSHLILNSLELDEVFNPFFATSGNDSAVISYTQMGLISTTVDGQVACGEDLPTIALDYTNVPVGQENPSNPKDFSNFYTTYRFLIKNNVKFSTGKVVDIKDILFNYYIYLDPVYTGASTMYSVDIQGLKAYRAQDEDLNQQENSESYFEGLGEKRVSNIADWCVAGVLPGDGVTEADIKADIVEVKKLFRQELLADWVAAGEQLDAFREEYKNQITEQWQVFLFLEGEIGLDPSIPEDEDKVIAFKGYDTNPPSNKSRDAMVDMVMNNKLGDDESDQQFKDAIYEILIGGWATGGTARTFFTAKEKEAHYKKIKDENDGELLVKSISGIKAKELQVGETFNGKTYNEKHQVLEIVINGVDPKAIWNFSINVVPMEAYTTPALAAQANGVDKFGVEFSSLTFMDNVVKRQMVPVGAGPYKAANPNRFLDNNIVSLVRNEHFLLGAPKIKHIDFKVISANSTFDAVQMGEVHFADVNAKPENKTKAINDKNLDYAQLDNLGYGYIGINARFVKELDVRRAFMYAMDTSLVLNYYSGGMASLIHRSMSTNSWAYPDGATAKYLFDSTGETSENLIKNAGYSKRGGIYGKLNAKGVWEDLRFTFTIAGDSNDHPAYATMAKAAAILNNIGCKITVISDNNALSKLSSGSLAVWAAAWGSTIDPDMYQVYHKDSQASSVLNWGYPEMLNNTDSTNQGNSEEKRIIGLLSNLIDEARQSLDNTEGGYRAVKYEEALDLLMELAVELPTYQRSNLFVYRADILDKETFNKDTSAYIGLLSNIWEISFKK